MESGHEDEYRDLVECFVRWCGENYLQVNVAKTKEMAVDFSRSEFSPVCISRTNVKVVESYTVSTWASNWTISWSGLLTVDKEGLSQLYFWKEVRGYSKCSISLLL